MASYAGRRALARHLADCGRDAMAKRDLAKIGVTHLDQLERPLPSGMLATVRLALRTGRRRDGAQPSRRFDVTGIEPVEPEPFAPTSPARPDDRR